jgi:DNA uptake protein ComE-like DNA-binding protein
MLRRTRTVLALAGSLTVAASCGLHQPRHGDQDRAHDERGRNDRVDLNAASWRALSELPGISASDADRIIANRPYRNRRALVRKTVLSEQKFDAIRNLVYVDREIVD